MPPVRKPLAMLAAASLALFMFATPAMAETLVDQEVSGDGSGGAGGVGTPDMPMGQTFTPTVNNITGFDFWMWTDGTYSVQIRRWADQAVLASFDATLGYGSHVDLAVPVSLVPGTEYAILLVAGPAGTMSVAQDANSGYSAGTWVFRGSRYPFYDAVFKTYYTTLLNTPAEPLGDWVYNEGTGHWYAQVNGMTWEESEAYAQDLGGHLVTINDAAEQNWLGANFTQDSLWIGLNDFAQEGTMVWSSGEPVTYTNWWPGEPNNGTGFVPTGEDGVVMNFQVYDNGATWNDYPEDYGCYFESLYPQPNPDFHCAGLAGIVEIDTDPNPPETVVDQEQGSSWQGTCPALPMGQTFTPTAKNMTGFDISVLWDTGSYTVEVWRWADRAVLSSLTATLGSASHVDLPAPIRLVPGTKYAIMIMARLDAGPSPCMNTDVNIPQSGGDPYTGGAFVYNGVENTFYDAVFKTYYTPAGPDAPSDLDGSAVLVGAARANITLNWTDNSSIEASFQLQRATDAGFTTGLASAPLVANTITATQTKLPRGVTYYYRVLAKAAGFRSSWSNVFTITPGAGLPADPSGLVVTRAAGEFVLSWMDNATDETGFVIERSVDGAPFAPFTTLPASDGTGPVSHTDTDVLGELHYHQYRVAAENGAGRSAWITSSVFSTPPNAPSGLDGSAVVTGSTASITLTWTDNSKVEASYQLQRATDEAFATGLASAPLVADTTMATQTKLAPGTYYYRVRAKGGGTTSAWSNVFMITTP